MTQDRKDSRNTQTPQIKDPVPPKIRDTPPPKPRDQQFPGQQGQQGGGLTDPLDDLADKLPPAVN